MPFGAHIQYFGMNAQATVKAPRITGQTRFSMSHVQAWIESGVRDDAMDVMLQCDGDTDIGHLQRASSNKRGNVYLIP